MLPGAVNAQQPVRGFAWVNFDSAPIQADQPPTPIYGLLGVPTGEGPFPALVLMHGCGGMLLTNGGLQARYRQWLELLRDEGYVVLLADSFDPRGYREICTQSTRAITPAQRPQDARGALAYLQAQSFVDPNRIGLIGWSNGGGSTLATLVGPLSATADPVPLPKDLAWFAVGVAFYPGC